MKAVIQRVQYANVKVEGNSIGEIQKDFSSAGHYSYGYGRRRPLASQ